MNKHRSAQRSTRLVRNNRLLLLLPLMLQAACVTHTGASRPSTWGSPISPSPAAECPDISGSYYNELERAAKNPQGFEQRTRTLTGLFELATDQPVTGIELTGPTDAQITVSAIPGSGEKLSRVYPGKTATVTCKGGAFEVTSSNHRISIYRGNDATLLIKFEPSSYGFIYPVLVPHESIATYWLRARSRNP